jgi:hypothetical protein
MKTSLKFTLLQLKANQIISRVARMDKDTSKICQKVIQMRLNMLKQLIKIGIIFNNCKRNWIK